MPYLGVSSPKITSKKYAESARTKCAEAISSGAVDLGTADMFDRKIDADMRGNQAQIGDMAILHTNVARRAMARHEVRKDRASRHATDVESDLVEESEKLAELDAQIAARRMKPDQTPFPEASEQERRRMERLRASLRNVGDSPRAAMFTWIVLFVLMCVDVPLLKIMVAQAVAESTLASWSLAVAAAVALTFTAGLACELHMRWLEHGLAVHRWYAGLCALLWVGGVAASAWFRIQHPIQTAGSQTAVTVTARGRPNVVDQQQATESAINQGDLGTALMLTGLLVLTGAVAVAITALHHDQLQRQRRASVRRRVRLRRWLRLMRRAESRHDKAISVQQEVIKDIDAQARGACEQILWASVSLKQDVRHWMANALGDPAATSALMDQPELSDRADGGIS